MSSDINDQISLAERVVKKARSYGAEEVEAYISWTKSLTVNHQSGLTKAAEGENAGVGIRAIIGKRVGFAAVSSMEPKKMFEAAEQAVKVARITPEDPKFAHLPDPIKRSSQSGYYDNNVMTLTPSDLMKQLNTIVNETKDVDQQIVYVDGDISAYVWQFAAANSRGINCGDSATQVSGGIYCKAKKNGEEKEGFESISSRKVIDFTSVGETAAKRAIKSLGAKTLAKLQKLPVLFDNYTSPMFFSILAYAISARSVQEQRSALSNKLNEAIAVKGLTVIDDSQMEEGLNTIKYDAEGIPTTVKPIIEKGILRNFLYDSYTAHADGKISTGNAVRMGEDFLQTPTISPMNYYITPGHKTLQEIISCVDEGLLVRYSLMGVGHSNVISGDFSVVATNAFYIKDKTIIHPLRPVTIAGNVYDALMKIMEIGSDQRLSMVGKTPSIMVSDLTCTP
jgi:PmbA protein